VRAAAGLEQALLVATLVAAAVAVIVVVIAAVVMAVMMVMTVVMMIVVVVVVIVVGVAAIIAVIAVVAYVPDVAMRIVKEVVLGQHQALSVVGTGDGGGAADCGKGAHRLRAPYTQPDGRQGGSQQECHERAFQSFAHNNSPLTLALVPDFPGRPPAAPF